MIKYKLKCTKDHIFDGWFKSSAAFDYQKVHCLLECPVCGDADIERALMAPAVQGARKREDASEALASSIAAQTNALLDPETKAKFTELRKLRDKLLSQSEDVGHKFAEEARKIHHGEAKSRGIYGKATSEEAKSLSDEGVSIAPIPIFPEDRN